MAKSVALPPVDESLVDRFLHRRAAFRALGLSLKIGMRLEKYDKQFPKPVQLGESGHPYFRVSELNRWLTRQREYVTPPAIAQSTAHAVVVRQAKRAKRSRRRDAEARAGA